MRVEVEWKGKDETLAQLAKIKDPDMRQLMAEWATIRDTGNRRGVMGGIGGDGEPLVPTSYRRSLLSANPKRKHEGLKANARLKPGNFGVAETNDNLTTSQYRKLTGPPLAPRGERSRVISNYYTAIGRDGTGWYCDGAWKNVISRTGVAFLRYHFNGATKPGTRWRLPRRDLRGIRPVDMKACQNALTRWANRTISLK